MKCSTCSALLISLFLSISSLNAISQITLTYDEFAINTYPKKCIDTLVFNYVKSYPNCTLKLFLQNCSGAAFFEVRGKNGMIKVKGRFDSGRDTLKKYLFAQDIGITDGKSHTVVSVIKYIYPLKSGVWRYYDSKGKIKRKEEYEYTFY
jgi:hypothetical protein